MRRFLALLVAAALFLPLSAERAKAALFPLTSNVSDTPEGRRDAEGIRSALNQAIGNECRVFSMVNLKEIDTILGEKARQNLKISEQVAEAQKKINGVKYVLVGQLDFLGNAYTLSVQILELDCSEITSATAYNIKQGEQDDFKRGATEIAKSLFAPPVPPDGSLEVRQDKKRVSLEWEEAEDATRFMGLLEYKAVYSERERYVTSEIQANAKAKVAMDWTQNAIDATFDVPDEKKTYYFTVLVRNPLGATALYEVKSSTGATVQEAAAGGASPSRSAGASRSVTSEGFVLVEGGTFSMGSRSGDGDEKPVHSVTVSSFYICRHEVTQEEWKKVMGGNPSYFKGDKRPVENVSWRAAIDYCNKRSLAEGLTPCYRGSGDDITCDFRANGYRLPTEAEWEYAARGGNRSYLGTDYSGSGDIGSVAWYDGNSGGETHEVMQKLPNELGLYDMSGNVWEWCWDWYDSGYYGRSPSRDPLGASSGSGRVLRGGSWRNYASYCRVANRYSPGYVCDNLGFRLVRSSSSQNAPR